MVELENKKYKHLSLSERIKIEEGLNLGLSVRKIAENINRAPSTIVYEISNRKIFKEPNYFNGRGNVQNCEKLTRASSVCNGCNSKIGCRKKKYYYVANGSQKNYEEILVDSRLGIDMDCEEFIELNNIVKENIEKGHSFYMIVQNNQEINVTERTLYNYQEAGYLLTKNIDLPRKMRYKKRKRSVSKSKKDRSVRKNRTYDDFKTHIADNSISHYIQMDTVEGVKGGECFFTMAFIPENFLLAYKMEKQTIEEVKRIIMDIKNKIGFENFYRYFNVILTDNGSEFNDISFIENNGEIIKNSMVFFCDPYRSDQKAELEVTHEYIRRYIPKGKDIGKYTDEQTLLMINNINSVVREKHSGETAYEVLEKRIPKEIFKVLELEKVKPKDIILNGGLFK